MPENNVNQVSVSGDRVTDGSIDRVPEEIVELLNEYKEIITDDIPNGLPPVRSIIHCIDLIVVQLSSSSFSIKGSSTCLFPLAQMVY